MKYGFEWSFSFFRSVLFIAPSIVLATAFWGALSLLVSYFDQGGRKQSWMAKMWARTLLLVSGTRVKVEGLEKLDPQGSYIFAANHRSYMDTPVLLASLPGQFRFMAKEGLFKIPLMGGHLQRGGHIPVPQNPREAIKSMSEAGHKIHDNRLSVLIFPEGGRTIDGRMDPFQEGAAFIAIKGNVTIVPVGLIGTYELLPMHSVHVQPRHITVRIGNPIDTSEMNIKQRGELTEELFQRVSTLISYT